jgi:hypothetical protein
VNTKETIQKKINGRASKAKDADPKVKEFLNYWGETFQKETGQPHTFSYGKDGSLVKQLLRVHSFKTLQDIAKDFFEDEECRRRGWTIGVFFQEINRLIGLKKEKPYNDVEIVGSSAWSKENKNLI